MLYQIYIFLAIFGLVVFVREKFLISFFTAPLVVSFLIISILYIADLIFDDISVVTGVLYLFAYACVIRWMVLNRLYLKNEFLYIISGCSMRGRSVIGFLLVACSMLYFFTINVKFSSWDEFTHWGTVIKYLAMESTLYDIASPLAAKDYPPGTALFAYFMLFIPGYSEGGAIFSFSILTLILILPLIGIAYKLGGYYWVAVSIVLYGLISKLGNGWSTVLIDHYISLTFAAIIIYYFSYSNNFKNLLLIPMLLFGFATLKDSAALFALLLGGLISMDLLLFTKNKYAGLNDTHQEIYKLAALVIVAPIILILTWKLHLYFYQIQPTLGASSVELLKRFFNCCSSERELLVTKKFIEAYFGFGSGDFISNYFNKEKFIPFFSYVCAMISFLFYIKSDKENRSRYLFLLIFLLSVFSLYTLMNYLWYLYGFDDREGMGLASFKRYNDVTTLALTIISIWIFILFVSKFKSTYSYVLLCVLFLLIIISPPFNLISDIRNVANLHSIGYDKRRAPIHEIGVILNKQLPKRSSVAIAWQGSDGFETWVLKYELLPRRTNIKHFEYCPSTIPVESKNDVPFACRLDLQEIKKRVSDFEYLYVAHGLIDLRGLYPDFYSGPSDIDTALYKVIPNGNVTHLKYLPVEY